MPVAGLGVTVKKDLCIIIDINCGCYCNLGAILT